MSNSVIRRTGAESNAMSSCSRYQTQIKCHFALTNFYGETNRIQTTAMTSVGRCFVWWWIISSLQLSYWPRHYWL